MNSTPAKALAWNLNNIIWQEISPDGTKYSLLEGRRDSAGEAFTYAFFIPAGFWDPAHWHTADARITVLQGKLYLGYGDKHEEEKLQAYEAGSYILVPADAKHFDGSYEDTVIIGTAVGPWATHYVDSSVIPSAGTQSI
ncbi:MAG: cupin domain-containing protein [Chloroflexota bacterium]